MTDINKIVLKLTRDQRSNGCDNALAVFADPALVESIAPHFGTLFVHSNNKIAKGRNIVYRDKLADLDVIINIGIILIHESRIDILPQLEDVFLKNKIPVMTFTSGSSTKEYYNRLDKLKYVLVDKRKNCNIWTFSK